MENDEGPRTPTETVAQRMRKLRRARGLTAAQLAERMAKAGIPWKPGVVAKLEKGYRENVSVDELLALAAVLDVAPVHLLIPTEEGTYQLTPTTTVDTVTARAWLRGFTPLPDTDPRDFYAEVPLCELPRIQPTGPQRQFEQLLRGWLQRVLVHPARDATVEWELVSPEKGKGDG